MAQETESVPARALATVPVTEEAEEPVTVQVLALEENEYDQRRIYQTGTAEY